MYEKSLVRLVVTLSRFLHIETIYIIVARWEVRLQAAVEVGQQTQHAIYQARVHTLQFPYIETTYIIVARWEVRLKAAVEVGQRSI
jgi:hypothetical protein